MRARTPRTATRHLPAGTLSTATVWVFALACCAGFVASTLLFYFREPSNPWPLYLSGPVLLFVLGALVAYWTLPKALNFLLGFAGQGFAPLLTGDRYLTFVMLVALSFGLAFEFPIVLIFLLLAGAVTTRQLRDWRRRPVLGAVVSGAARIPCGVMSNAHARIRAIGNPTSSNRITRRNDQGGNSQAGNVAEASWIMPPAAMMYAAATR